MSGRLLLFRQSLRLFSFCSAARIFLGLGLRFQFGLSRGFCIRLGFGLRICGSLARRFFALSFFSPQGKNTCVFGRLHGTASSCTDWSASLLALVVVLRALQHVFGFHDAVLGVLLCARGLGDRHGVTSFEQIERDSRGSLRRWQLVGLNIDHVFLALEDIKLRVNCFFEALRSLQDHILGDDLIAWMDDGEVWFGRDDHAERLKVGRDRQLVLAISSRQHFAEIDGTPFRRNAPQHIGQIFGTELRRRIHVVEFDVNRQTAGFAVDLGLAGDRWHAAGSLEIDRGRSAAIAVVHRSCAARIDVHAENRRLGIFLNGLIRL